MRIKMSPSLETYISLGLFLLGVSNELNILYPSIHPGTSLAQLGPVKANGDPFFTTVVGPLVNIHHTFIHYEQIEKANKPNLHVFGLGEGTGKPRGNPPSTRRMWTNQTWESNPCAGRQCPKPLCHRAPKYSLWTFIFLSSLSALSWSVGYAVNQSIGMFWEGRKKPVEPVRNPQEHRM